MRVAFMGTPDFAAASLERLIADGFEICAVFTQPDKSRGRGMAVSFSPVKTLAIEHSLPVFQPDTMRSDEVKTCFQNLKPDIIAVVAYGKLIPDDIIMSAKYGAINLHGSILPKYRGAAPIQWAVLNGDRTTGVCTFYLCSDMDAGDLIYTEETEIGEFETSGELFDRLKVLGAALLSRTIRDIEAGTAPRVKQNGSNASYVSRLDKSLSPIDWRKSPREIIKWIYGLQPWPVATMILNETTCKVFRAEYTDRSTEEVPGTILNADNAGIEISCGSGSSVLITELQAPGKRRMSAADYLRGHPIIL